MLYSEIGGVGGVSSAGVVVSMVHGNARLLAWELGCSAMTSAHTATTCSLILPVTGGEMDQTGSSYAAGARAPRKMKATTLWPDRNTGGVMMSELRRILAIHM